MAAQSNPEELHNQCKLIKVIGQVTSSLKHDVSNCHLQLMTQLVQTKVIGQPANSNQWSICFSQMHAPTVYRLNFELSISFHKALLSILIRIIWPGNLILSLITNFYSFSAKRQLKCKKKFPFILLAHLTMPHVPSNLFLFSGRIASCTLRNPDNDLLLLIRAADAKRAAIVARLMARRRPR